MDKTIWKFYLGTTGRVTIQTPFYWKPLCVQVQDGEVCLWAVVSETNNPVARTFATYGTGHPLPADPGTYLGTYQLQGGRLVFHVFEV